MPNLCRFPIFLDQLDAATDKLSSPNQRQGRVMKQITWKACSALIHQCLFPQIMPGSSAAVMRHASASTSLSEAREQTMLITVLIDAVMSALPQAEFGLPAAVH